MLIGSNFDTKKMLNHDKCEIEKPKFYLVTVPKANIQQNSVHDLTDLC